MASVTLFICKRDVQNGQMVKMNNALIYIYIGPFWRSRVPTLFGPGEEEATAPAAAVVGVPAGERKAGPTRRWSR